MIQKENTILITDHYNNPKTSLVTFHFAPAAAEKLNRCSIHHASIENKDLYVFDNYFQKDARDETRNYFEAASYSRYSYSTANSGEEGEKPGYSMNTKERWKLFSNPPPSILQLHQFLSSLSARIDAKITTAPWELSHKPDAVTPSVIINYHTEVSNESMRLGVHRDCHPAKGIFFGIPILYQEPGRFHDNCFENGAPGKPWVVSALLYVASEHFLPAYRMGTVFYREDGNAALKTNCLDGRFILFEGDLFHSVEESNVPSDQKVWRVSYVLKLLINPKKANQNVKEQFSQLVRDWSSPVHKLALGKRV